MDASEHFHHPFQPYDIQLQFMRALYECIEAGKIGIFESPTGTGKSLSLACGSLTWLRDRKRKEFDDSLASLETDDDEPEWMVQHSREEKKRQVIQKRAELEAQLDKIRRQERKIRERQENGPPYNKKRKLDDSIDPDILNEDQFVLDDYESDDDTANHFKKADSGSDLGLSRETQALMQKLGYSLTATPKEEDAEPEDEIKIYFCSRTHSQLTQFVNELRRIKLPPAIPIHDEPQKPHSEAKELHEELKHISLGSRKNLCINPKVSSLKTPTAINERCLELQDAKTASEHKCPFVPNKENEASVLDFQHHSLAKIRDIEDLGTLGKKLGVCPYYATRPAVKPSEIVTLPYPLLLQKSAREALGLSLKNHVVIIDEAHNLMDAIAGIYTIELSLGQLQRAREQLTVYLQKFRNRLKGKNRVYVTQVVRLLDSLTTFLKTAASDKKATIGTVQATELLRGKGVDQINLHKLMNYLQESKLARKVEGYVAHEKQRQQDKTVHGKSGEQQKDISVPVLTHVQNLFMVLTNPAREGRLFYTLAGDSADTRLKYMLLDPSEHFREIVEDARAVILAGGTMSPMDDYTQQLFPYLDSSRITTLSCGHVIPPSNLFVSPVVQSSKGVEFDFTFTSRNSLATIKALGETIISVLSKVPDGVVIFFPSYAYLDQVVSQWQKLKTEDGVSIWFCMELAKNIFKESKVDTPLHSSESALDAYTDVVNMTSPRGALLLAVIGGKLSEGINFSDKLGRCVMVVGLPYPNPHSPEWKAKTEYIEGKAAEKGLSGGSASREFAENVCMRAVNQAIGRAVRHKGDWASILLFDKRYAQKRIMDKLPTWIRASLPQQVHRGFKEVESGLQGFFAEKKAKGM